MSFKLEKVVHGTEGRYFVITVFLYGEHVVIGSAYAPNTFDGSIYSKLLADLSSICPPFVILGGDFNCGLLPQMDYNPSKTLPLSRMAKATKDLCSELGLFDAWRIINPQEQDLIFFSRPHQPFSRIDYLFQDQLLIGLNPALLMHGSFQTIRQFLLCSCHLILTLLLDSGA